MNTSQILDLIEKKLQDSSYDRDDDLLPVLNEGLLFIAGIRPLPVLLTSGEVETELAADAVAMPADYHAHLISAFNVTQNIPIAVYYTLNTLREKYISNTNAGGSAYGVAAEDSGYLHYRRIPDPVETIRLGYYKIPETLIDDENSPDAIPEQLRRQTLVNYVLWQFFEDIEDGAEGQKINTQYYQEQFVAGLSLLDQHLPPTSRPRREFPRKVSVF